MPEVEPKFQKRQTAYKVMIKDILNSKYIKTEGFDPNYIEVNEKEVSRINVIGIVVQKSGPNDTVLTIDDGTGKISARIFENNALFQGICISDVVLIIGRPREFSSEKYILIETIKKIGPLWAKVRKMELDKCQKTDNLSQDETQNIKEIISDEEEVIDLSPSNKIIRLIKELDKGNGVSIDELSSKGIDNLDKIIKMLMNGGDIFEIRPGKLKVLE